MAAMTRRVGVPRGADEESGARMGSGGGGAGMGGMGSGALDGADQFMADKKYLKILTNTSGWTASLLSLRGPQAQLAVGGAVVLGLLAVLMLPVGVACVVFVLEVCAAGVAFSLWLSRYILSRDEGTPEMQEISNPIKEGAEGFLKVQYTAIFRIAALLAVVIMFSYLLRPIDTQNPQGVERLGNFMLGLLASVSFILGALCSAAAGYISMWVSANSNIRVASAATRSYGEALLVCFRGGAFSAVLDITLCVFGVTMLYVIYYLLFASTGVITPTDVPMLLVGYGFGASFVALFMQLGGGIYTKAADVGADLVGKIEHGIPEDDPRNPAVIADLVGDMVGDCVGSSADVFESVAAEIIGAMILSSTLAAEANIENPIRFVFFPLIVHALDIVVSSVGILSVRHKGGAISASPSGGSAAAGGAGVGAGGASASSAGDATAAGSALGGSSAVDGVGGSGGGVVGGGVDGSGMPTAVNGADGLAADGGNTTSGGMVDKGPPPGAANQARLAQTSNPMDPFVFGYRIAAALAFIAFGFTARFLLYVEASPSAWLHYYGCGIVGMLTGYIFIQSTQYFTDYEFAPVRSIAEASTTGHGTNIITGVAVGMKSTVIPCITVSLAVVMSYHLGFSAGVGAGHNAGLFGTAVATMGMLSSAAFVLSMNNFGPVADNAGGIVEMSRQAEYVRTTTDRLDAAGNVTKAITKGYSIGSAALACFLLFGAFLDEFSQFSGVQFRVVDIAVPEVLVGGLLGSGMVFYFTGLTVAAVGKTASEVVVEVRRQLRDNPEIMNFRAQPDYRSCVSIVTRAALREMRYPGILAVGMPVLTGLTFRFVGYFTNRPMLGAEVLASYLMFATVTGILMALFLDNVGGAWDNAKKYIEAGHYGGKGSEAHKAAITGDTVGDPFKDTAGPSLHVVIKLLSTTVLVMGPLFVNS